ncbi:hybrid sensor histidine kinase/response regulator transcription factor [Dysgonomonas gadei]|uniref:histidine kinase n=1 Tax=Dysgonomonas gadei ATCC BAA-286 TaxID=742766 RepID=F5J297_9BACT|nr:two-component regulator propeller domain-containing protein [Dysgonomonas gadei]EGK00217.1 hypothetical protein HMPREF9455_03356 [Dysgonomonas gadei ATCC BAA-286]
MKKRAIYTIILLLTTHCNILYSYNIRKINDAENLSNSSVTALCQDSKGILWIGTCDGLNIYNGNKVTLFQSVDKNQVLSGTLIDKITEVEKKSLWVQTYYGIDRLSEDERTLQNFKGFNKILHTAKDNHNNFFIIKKDSCIFHYNKQNNQFDSINLPQIKFKNIAAFFIDNNNTIYIIDQNGTIMSYTINYQIDGKIVLKEGKSFKHQHKIIFNSQSGNYLSFVDENYGLYEFNMEKQKVSFIINVRDLYLKNGLISSILKYQDDFFIGFKTTGLFRLKHDVYSYTVEKLPINSGVFCLLKDRFQDIIWIGTDGQGVYSYSNSDLYSIHSTLLNEFTFSVRRPIRAMYIDNERTLWLGSKGDGIVKINEYDLNKNLANCKIEYISMDNSSLWDNSVYCIRKSKKNILWIGTEEGLNYYSFKDKKIKRINLLQNGINIKYIHDVYEQDSILWIASVGMGIIKTEINLNGDVVNLKIADKYLINNGDISSNYFFSFFADGQNLWAANRGSGVFKINTQTGQMKNISFNSNTLDEIYSIARAKDYNYLIGTGSGLIKYKNSDEYKVMNKNSGLSNNVIHCILPEEDTTFWLSTNNGIINYDSQNDFFRRFNYHDGLEVIEFSDGASFADEKTGCLFFGGINGFVSISKNKSYSPNEYMPDLDFDGLSIMGKPCNIIDYLSEKKGENILTLSHDQNFFSISYNAIDYINGNNYTYHYKFENINSDWVDNGNSNSISLTNFAAGEYTLSVKYNNPIIGKESPVYQLKLIILPPWYKTFWAYILYSITILMFFGLIVRSIIIRSKKRKKKALIILKQKHKENVYESKLKFFTNIAHEFCTPLTLIYGPCNRILNQENTDTTIIKYAKIIQQNAERLNSLIQDLIDFRRIESGHKNICIERINISSLINYISSSFSDLAESKNVTFERDVPLNIEWNSDKEFLITIIINLLSNAFKYTTNEGYVKIEIEIIEGILHITIANSGKGIKPENISKIFDRYSILDDFENQTEAMPFSRNGLGLAISNSMAALLGGKIDIESSLNQLTCFILKLPFIENPKGIVAKQGYPEIKNAVLENKEAIIEPSTYNDLKPILLAIDDEPEILWLIKDTFNDEFNVIMTANSNQAFEILKEMHPHIILCDILMPSTDGIGFTQQIKSNPQTAHIPLVLISAGHEIEKQIEGMKAGAELYITKPFNTDYLKTSIKQLLSRKETLKDYFSSPQSAFELAQGKFRHKEHKKFMKDILAIIDKNIDNKDLSVPFIADKVGMSNRNLYRKINEINDNISIADIIREKRLHIAQDLLLRSKYTIGEIAFKSGFANKVSFFKAFSKRYGCTPNEYKKQNRL